MFFVWWTSRHVGARVARPTCINGGQLRRLLIHDTAMVRSAPWHLHRIPEWKMLLSSRSISEIEPAGFFSPLDTPLFLLGNHCLYNWMSIVPVHIIAVNADVTRQYRCCCLRVRAILRSLQMHLECTGEHSLHVHLNRSCPFIQDSCILSLEHHCPVCERNLHMCKQEA